MKTREKILQTSLLLFNEDGESHVTTVDIANEMDISPGNLYYHFKGKDVIIDTLYTRFDQSMTEILHAPLSKDFKIEDGWYYLYVVFEEMYHYRFIYQNLTDLLHRYESLRKRFRRLLNLKSQTAHSMVTTLREAGLFTIDDREVDVLVDNMIMTLTYWIAYANLLDTRQPAEVVLHKGVYQMLSLIAPYFTEGRQEYRDLCHQFYREKLGEVQAGTAVLKP